MSQNSPKNDPKTLKLVPGYTYEVVYDDGEPEPCSFIGEFLRQENFLSLFTVQSVTCYHAQNYSPHIPPGDIAIIFISNLYAYNLISTNSLHPSETQKLHILAQQLNLNPKPDYNTNPNQLPV